MADILILFGKRVAELRKEKGYSQEGLAEAAGIDLSSIGRMERGKGNPTLGAIAKISGALGVEIGDLFPFKSGKKETSERDRIRNELISLLYECDEGMLELVLRATRDLKKYLEKHTNK